MPFDPLARRTVSLLSGNSNTVDTVGGGGNPYNPPGRIEWRYTEDSILKPGEWVPVWVEDVTPYDPFGESGLTPIGSGRKGGGSGKDLQDPPSDSGVNDPYARYGDFDRGGNAERSEENNRRLEVADWKKNIDTILGQLSISDKNAYKFAYDMISGSFDIYMNKGSVEEKDKIQAFLDLMKLVLTITKYGAKSAEVANLIKNTTKALSIIALLAEFIYRLINGETVKDAAYNTLVKTYVDLLMLIYNLLASAARAASNVVERWFWYNFFEDLNNKLAGLSSPFRLNLYRPTRPPGTFRI